MDDLNVFDEYMPGGGFRIFSEEFGIQITPEQNNLLIAIDDYVSSTGFDIRRYSRLRKISDEASTRFVELLRAGEPSTSERVNAFKNVGQRASQLMYEMHKPVYERMLALGFPDSLLRGNTI